MLGLAIPYVGHISAFALYMKYCWLNIKVMCRHGQSFCLCAPPGPWPWCCWPCCAAPSKKRGPKQFYPNGRYGRRSVIPPLAESAQDFRVAVSGDDSMICKYTGFADYYRCSRNVIISTTSTIIPTRAEMLLYSFRNYEGEIAPLDF
ncbi:uncharacterized protein CEXT_539621 [Caerostris extrusa]|uniref:Uncharacterized protein n=1 Tax=Caerostris extrusa TaxID=172846 RepID=A0AAV4UUQ8_CAEEX|nr:uncharacterized protein CEXT_539621 [Caerostris extrusa]